MIVFDASAARLDDKWVFTPTVIDIWKAIGSFILIFKKLFKILIIVINRWYQ